MHTAYGIIKNTEGLWHHILAVYSAKIILFIIIMIIIIIINIIIIIIL